jgi:hypothetical protein
MSEPIPGGTGYFNLISGLQSGKIGGACQIYCAGSCETMTQVRMGQGRARMLSSALNAATVPGKRPMRDITPLAVVAFWPIPALLLSRRLTNLL